MGLFTRKKSFEEIAWGLSVPGMNTKNNCMFITDASTDNIVKEFLQKHDVSELVNENETLS